jgi:nucleotide-binding universal stress UspA family protein
MFRHIIVPLDGSPLAERALPYATQLATAVGATAHLVYVAESPSSAWSPFPAFLSDGAWEAELQRITDYLARMRRPLDTAGIRVRTECIVEMAGTAALLGYERAARIDLVVMCADRHVALPGFAPGRLAARLRYRSAAPVLHVPVSGEPIAWKPVSSPPDELSRAHDGLDGAPGPAAANIRVMRWPSNRDEREGT